MDLYLFWPSIEIENNIHSITFEELNSLRVKLEHWTFQKNKIKSYFHYFSDISLGAWQIDLYSFRPSIKIEKKTSAIKKLEQKYSHD